MALTVAKIVIKEGDTYPFLQGTAVTASGGLLPINEAVKLQVAMKAPLISKEINGTAEYHLETDEEGVERNWRYKWAAEDTKYAGLYYLELIVTWSEATSPHEIEYLPSEGSAQVEIQARVG